MIEGLRQSNPLEMFKGYCERLVEDGIDIGRATLGVPLFHPQAQSAYASWGPETGVSGDWYVWTEEALKTLRNSPIFPIYQEGKSDRIRLTDPTEAARFPICEELAEQGFTDYLAIPLPFSDGSFKALTLATSAPGGFSKEDFTKIDATITPLSIVVEAFLAKRTATTLLETYIGPRAGARVLDGQIKRGDGSFIQAVIWMSDLRNFTGLAQTHETNALMERLNRYLGTVVEAVSEQEGEVLKFIGDAVLAVFPYKDGGLSDAVARAELAALKSLSEVGTEDWPQDLRFGIALHNGTVFYGNIGGTVRLDFTVIGPSVNVASRMEGLCAEIDAPLLVSQNIVDVSDRIYSDCGLYTLKGVDHPMRVFRLAEGV